MGSYRLMLWNAPVSHRLWLPSSRGIDYSRAVGVEVNSATLVIRNNLTSSPHRLKILQRTRDFSVENDPGTEEVSESALYATQLLSFLIVIYLPTLSRHVSGYKNNLRSHRKILGSNFPFTTSISCIFDKSISNGRTGRRINPLIHIRWTIRKRIRIRIRIVFWDCVCNL